jgi:hypothetical protein
MTTLPALRITGAALMSAAIFILLADPAAAQQITAATTYGVANIGRPLINAMIVGLGGLALLFRAHWTHVAMVATGALGIANYAAIGGLLGGA